MEIQTIKQRFGIIGNSPLLDRAIDIARQVAPTDITVLITGESGTGKEVFPKIIHQLSARKHGPYIAVNCGAIPEGTIDSELFGHEKGSFTGASESRKGYFEVVNGGTIFLDEVAELPLSTQVRLLRVLESGEFMRVGSSRVIKTDVRVVAASNVNIPDAIHSGKFRQDLYYRLNTVPIHIPTLNQRKEDIILLFRKFAADFAERYRMPPIQMSEEAQDYLIQYHWQGNVRQLKNVTEQISIIEENRFIASDTLKKYLPDTHYTELPVLYNGERPGSGISERDLLYKVLFDMRRDINDMKRLIAEIMQSEGVNQGILENSSQILKQLYPESEPYVTGIEEVKIQPKSPVSIEEPIHPSEILEESLSLAKKEMDMIKKALDKHAGKRKNAARELGISERTLYRKIKEYNIQ